MLSNQQNLMDPTLEDMHKQTMDIEFVAFLKQHVLHVSDFELFSTLFDISAKEACKILKISLSVLKKRCRKCGIKKWPYRQLAALSKLKKNVYDPNDVRSIDNCVQNIKKNPSSKLPNMIINLMHKSRK